MYMASNKYCSKKKDKNFSTVYENNICSGLMERTPNALQLRSQVCQNSYVRKIPCKNSFFKEKMTWYKIMYVIIYLN